MKRHPVARGLALAMLCWLVFGVHSHWLQAQSSATLTQTVNKRGTIGVVTVSPSASVSAGASAAFTAILHTGGAPAPTSETMQFYDGASTLGAAQTITQIAATNLLPYSQVNTSQGWTALGAATFTANAVNGPDGSQTATTGVLPSSASANQGAQYAVSGTSYASQAMTLSLWAKAAAATTLTLGITDNPAVNAASTSTCALTTSWQRCTLTYTFPANANTGFIFNVYTTGQGAATVYLWGAQAEQASSAGAYVSTIGTARTSGAYGGQVTYSTSALTVGSHTISAQYAGDANFNSSTSNSLAETITGAASSTALAVNHASPQPYGTSLTFTATVTGSAGTATGNVSFYDGATLLGTSALSAGQASITLSGLSALIGGSHSITAVYAGNTTYSTSTSAAMSYTITAASNAVNIAITSSLNPSTYGDSVTFGVTLTSLVSGVTPTGSMTLVDTTTSTTIGTYPLDGSGSASVTLSTLTAGSHALTFTYSGDGNYN